jgi:hypothetical protein
MVDLALELQNIYESEINVRIDWIWDGGIEVRLGDELNGFIAGEIVPSTAEVLPWLQSGIAHFYPGKLLCEIAACRNKRAGSLAPVPASSSWYAGKVSALRCTPRSSARYGGSVTICVPSLRQERKTHTAKPQ